MGVEERRVGLVRRRADPRAKAGPWWLSSSGSGGPTFFLNALVRLSIAELSVRVLVRQGSRGLAARDFDVVEQTPL